MQRVKDIREIGIQWGREIVWGNTCWNKNFYFIYFRELIVFQLFLYSYYYTYIYFFVQLTRKFDIRVK